MKRALTASEVTAELRRQGWNETNGGSHKKFSPPRGLATGERPLVMSYGTTSDKYADVIRKDLAKFGPEGFAVLDALDGVEQQPVNKKRAAPAVNSACIAKAPPNITAEFGIDIGGGLKAQVVAISPAIADRWLKLHSGPNRKVLQSRVEKYANDVVIGQWNGRNGETVVFDSNGKIADGQHRLHACIAAGKEIDALVVYGVAPLEAQRTMDTGATRSLGDLISMAGASHVAIVANATANAFKMRKPGQFAVGTNDARNATPQTLIRFLTDNPTIYTLQEITYDGDADRASQLFALEPDMPRWAEFMERRMRIGKGLYIATFWLFSKDTDADHEEIRTFFATTAAGFDLVNEQRIAFDPKDGRALLRRMIDNRAQQGGWDDYPTMKKAAYIIKAWNLWRNGGRQAHLSWKPNAGEAFPKAY